MQINTALKKTVKIGSYLRLEARVSRREGKRKVWVEAKLSDPDNPEVVYCEANGLFLSSSASSTP